MKTLTGLLAKKHILDPVQGMIPITEPELKIISNPLFQRLRNITQLGVTSLVYPGAVHNRFMHSLGTMQIMDKLLYVLGQENLTENDRPQWERITQEMRFVALLHDCGHFPFSHIFERFKTKEKHEYFCNLLVQRSSIATDLQDLGYNPKHIGLLISEKVPVESPDAEILTKLLPLLHSDADADRIDYLMRDAFFTGVPFGRIDFERISQCVTLHNERICFHEKAQDSLEDFLLSRFQMYKKVYTHKTVICYDLILRKIYEILERSASQIDIPFILPREKDFEKKPRDWFDENFLTLTETSFFQSINKVLKNKESISSNDAIVLEKLRRCLRERTPIKNCYRKDEFPLRIREEVSIKKTGSREEEELNREYCEKEKNVIETLKETNPGILEHWSFLRHNPDKPLEIATPIKGCYDDTQEHEQIRILRETTCGNFEDKILQQIMGTFIKQLANHHRVFIAYYHEDKDARDNIRNIARKIFET